MALEVIYVAFQMIENRPKDEYFMDIQITWNLNLVALKSFIHIHLSHIVYNCFEVAKLSIDSRLYEQ